MKIKKYIRRYTTLFITLLFAGVSFLPLLGNDMVHAYGLVTSRSIEMSTSNPGAAASYLVGFTTATTGTIQGVVVDFCAGTSDPIIGDTCTAPTGFSVGTPTVTGMTGLSGTWVAGSLNSGRTLTLTNSSGGSVTSGTAVSFTITTVTNPTTPTGTFYARILTYATSGGATGYTAGTPGSDIDAGGIALSTAQQITITAKVQEQLTFCVYTGGTCGTGSTVTLGNTNGALSTSGPYVDKNTMYDVSTNALHGVVVNMEGPTLTTPSSNTIAAIGSTAAASAAGTSQFGMCTYMKTGGSGMTFPNATYSGGGNCSGTSQTAGTGSTGGAGSATFGFNLTNTTSTYGDQIAAQAAGAATGIIAFIGNVSATQVSGVYTTTLTFIATGTY